MDELFFTESLLAAGGGANTFKIMLIVAFLLVIFVVPFLLGNVIARALSLKELAGRISLVICVTFCGLAPFVWPQLSYQVQQKEYQAQQDDWENIQNRHEKDVEEYEKKLAIYRKDRATNKKPVPPEDLVKLMEPIEPALDNIIRKGIDLAGGTNLIFQVQFDAAAEEGKVFEGSKSAAMDQMLGAIIRRLNPSGTEEIVVRKVGEDRIEVIIPGADEAVVQQKKRQMTRLGSLEFGILATRTHAAHGETIRDALNLPPEKNRVLSGDVVAGRWHDVAVDRKTHEPKFNSGASDLVSRTVNRVGQTKAVRQFLVIYESEKEKVTGKFLKTASPGRDSQSGSAIVSFTFDNEGAYRFGQLTTKYQPRKADNFDYHLAILLDGNIESAPTINEPITGGRGQITIGDQAEVTELVNVLNAGALEVPINPIPVQELTMSPTLGVDVVNKGMMAIMTAGVVVLIFMVAYYWFAGIVADICLLMNIVLVMGAMVLINAAFTLPGLAGIVLTIGMAVDANVLIFERIREEINRGSSTRMAIQNGFDRAFTTIVDANVTTLLTAIVLYIIGTDQIRGFAVTLFIGIIMSMFTALYFGRLIFDIVEQKRWLKKINMFAFVGKTTIDFISKRYLATIVSCLLITAGMVALVSRRTDMLDIDFTGGMMITFDVEEPTTSSEVKKILEEKFQSSVTIEQLALPGEEIVSEKGKRFRMRTTFQENKENPIHQLVNDAFEGKNVHLLHNTITFGKVTEVPRGNVAIDKATPANQFSGGQQVELTYTNPVSQSVVLETFSEHLEMFKNANEGKETPKYEEAIKLIDAETDKTDEVQSTTKKQSTTWTLKAMPAVSGTDFSTALTSMQKKMAESPTFEGVNSFDSSVASEMKKSAFMAMFTSLIAIIGYIWFRFQRITFGLAAVVALVHDVLIVLGMVAFANWLVGGMGIHFLQLEEFKINLPMIAAFLTIVGYSLNDTIVVFDRIREVRGKNPNITIEMLNLSLNQTLSRTILTSLTTFIVVAILYFFGGEGIHGFAFCLVLGVIVGTYSSIYVASPALLWLMNRSEKTAKGSVSS